MTTAVRTEPRGRAVSGVLLGMILFVTSEVMFFGALFGTYLAARGASVDRGEAWPPAGVEFHLWLPIVLTAILLASSVTAHLALGRVKRGELAAMVRLVAVTAGLGALFLAGQLFEYTQLGFGLGDHAYTTLFFVITGFHGLHVLIGLVILGVTIISARRGKVTPAKHGHAEAATFYWHFVDAVWILVFVTLYLIR